jgi:Co/Zn/Cd efflux system component
MNTLVSILSGVVTTIMILAIHRVFTDIPMDEIGLWLYGGGIGVFVFYVVYRALNGSED